MVNSDKSFVGFTFAQFNLVNPRINCLSPVQNFPLLCTDNPTNSVSSISNYEVSTKAFKMKLGINSKYMNRILLKLVK